MKFLSFLSFCLLISLSGCVQDKPLNCDGLLFGIPNATTGLDNTKCKAICECKGFSNKEFSQADLNTLKTWELTDTIARLTSNPYNLAVPNTPDSVCAVKVIDLNAKLYTLENYITPDAALADGAILTHYDACGKCSTLKDFAVYAENIDIGADVRQCILDNLSAPFEDLVQCIEGLGFTKPCAQIWAYNAKNTQAECLGICLADTVYNKPDGSLSDCLQCDETKSGPVFKVVAGRTRRNTGIASSICRFCEEVQVVEHDYPL